MRAKEQAARRELSVTLAKELAVFVLDGTPVLVGNVPVGYSGKQVPVRINVTGFDRSGVEIEVYAKIEAVCIPWRVYWYDLQTFGGFAGAASEALNEQNPGVLEA